MFLDVCCCIDVSCVVVEEVVDRMYVGEGDHYVMFCTELIVVCCDRDLDNLDLVMLWWIVVLINDCYCEIMWMFGIVGFCDEFFMFIMMVNCVWYFILFVVSVIVNLMDMMYCVFFL